MKLRDYQIELIESARRAITGGARAPLIVVPTGGGKTLIGATIVQGAVARGRRVLWLAHRRELITQAAERMPVHAGIVMAGHPSESGAPVQVASIDTLVSRGARPPADLIVVDEAHHAVARTSRDLLALYPEAKLLGLTATPQRSDGTALGDVFDALIEGPTIRALMDAGHLVGCRVVAPLEQGSALASDPVEAWARYAEGRPGFVFARSVTQSQEIAARLTAAGVPAGHVDGKTAKGARDRAIDDFRRGRIDVLSSVAVFTEGIDLPRAAVCLLARGCDHVGAFLQMTGRVLRPATGKASALLIDLLGSVHKHGLPDDERAWSLEGRGVREQDEPRPALSQCLRCGGVWRSGRRDCPTCGWEMPEIRPMRIEERDLVDLTEHRLALAEKHRDVVRALRPHADEDERARKLAELRVIAASRGYQPKWVGMRYRAIYGEWPRALAGGE